MSQRASLLLACPVAAVAAGALGLSAISPPDRANAASSETAPAAGTVGHIEQRNVGAQAHQRQGTRARERARLGRQLLINQRISQATIHRANAIEHKLSAGLETEDIRDGALTAAKFGPGITITGSERVVSPAPNPRRPLAVPPLPSRTRTSLTPSATQLLINQRIAQAAVRRANALRDRMSGRLTGGDIRPRAITAEKLAPGLRITSFVDRPRPAPSPIVIAPHRPGASGAVTLSREQLLINQRISQAAIRRLNDLRQRIETGLTGDAFANGTITGANLAR